jgi:SNF2 family DNA or RNA helicase
MPLDLLPYQEEGAAYLAGRERAALYDEMGVGKTAQAIRAVDIIHGMHGIVVCPAAARQVWVGEFRKFSATPRRILKGSEIHHLKLFLKGRIDVLLLSYEMATAWAPRLEGELLDFLIFDEAHYLKGLESKRTKALLGSDLNNHARADPQHGLARWAAYVWFLTGTPNSNDAADFWTHARFCRATTLPKRLFADRYYRRRTGTYSDAHDPIDQTVTELRQVIRSFSLRRTKQEAGLKLPPIWLTSVEVDGDTSEIKRLLLQFPGLEKAIVDAVNQGGLAFLEGQHVMTLRRLIGEAKAPMYVEMLKEELENGLDKVVVFGVHIKALGHIRDALARAGYASVEINGSTSERQRMAAVYAFQNDPDCRVLLGNITAAGTALTLTASAAVDMFESAWNPAGNAQALMRVHRIGQERSVRARFIALANSIDETVSEIVARKAAAIVKTGTMAKEYA